jgi:hypothetical protein
MCALQCPKCHVCIEKNGGCNHMVSGNRFTVPSFRVNLKLATIRFFVALLFVLALADLLNYFIVCHCSNVISANMTSAGFVLEVNYRLTVILLSNA